MKALGTHRLGQHPAGVKEPRGLYIERHGRSAGFRESPAWRRGARGSMEVGRGRGRPGPRSSLQQSRQQRGGQGDSGDGEVREGRDRISCVDVAGER